MERWKAMGRGVMRLGACLVFMIMVQGCVQFDGAKVDATPYQMVERGKKHLFQIMGVWTHSPIIIGASARCDVLLVETPPRTDDWWAIRWVRHETPTYRNLNLICDHVKAAIPETRKDPAAESDEQPLWIISNDPLILGRGVEEIPSPARAFWWPYMGVAISFPDHLRLVTDADKELVRDGFGARIVAH